MSLLNQIHPWLKAYALLFLVVRYNRLTVARYKTSGELLWMEPVLRQPAQKDHSIMVIMAYPNRIVRLSKAFLLSRYLTDLNQQRASLFFTVIYFKNNSWNLKSSASFSDFY